MGNQPKLLILVWAMSVVTLLTMDQVHAQSPIVENRYIVELKSSPEETLGKPPKHALQNHNIKALQTQANFVKTASAILPSLSVKRQFSTLINAIEIELDAANIKRLQQLPDVKNVYPVRVRYGHLDASHQIINSVEAWSLLGGQSEAGRDIKIAIIDSGIRPENPMFDDAGYSEPDLSDNLWLQQHPDYCRKPGGDPNFCNNKVIIARVFVPADDALFPVSPDDMTPLDINRHGTHVAGIAAGNPVQINFQGVDREISGVAPGARLMVYKALFDNGGIVIGTDAMLLEALENAVKDGADVINNSWGSIQTGTPDDSVFASVFAAAEEQGVVIVSSAGNSGGFATGINCPGCIEAGITVANSFHGRVFGHKVTFNSQVAVGSTGGEQQTFDDLSGLVIQLPTPEFPMNNGCSPLPNQSLQDKVVLVEFSNQCLIPTLAENIQQAGAKALLLYETPLFAGSDIRPFRQFTYTGTLPVLGLTQVAANAIKEEMQSANLTVAISGTREAVIDSHAINHLNPGSSTGPNLNPNVLKPDITAPGTDILSAAAPEQDLGFPFTWPASFLQGPDIGEEPVFAMLSGTSMSSPQVAGAAALLRQRFPDWSAVQIKTALTSTSVKAIRSGETLASPFQQGAGVMDIAAAMNSAMTFAKASHADSACIGRCTFENTVQNTTDEMLNLSLDIVLDSPNAEAVLSSRVLSLDESTGSTPSATFTFDIDTSDVTPGTWVFGDVILSAQSVSQRLPIAVYANDNSDSSAVSTSVSQPEPTVLSAVTRVTNQAFTHTPKVTISAPDFADIDPTSLNVDIVYGESQSLVVSDSGQLVWEGMLNEGQMQLTSTFPWGNQTLKNGGSNPVACSDGCIDFFRQVEFPFMFQGEAYSGLTVTSNGFVVAGNVTLSAFDMSPANALPSEDNINNIIAPLWANYDLLDPQDPMDSGSGGLYIDSVIHQGERYLIAEWNGVSQFGFDDENDADTYTFQVVIKENSDEIMFNYITIPSLPFAIIGAENKDASLGVTYYNGQSDIDLPVPLLQGSASLALTGAPAGAVNISYNLVLPELQVNTMPDEVALDEDTALNIDVLQNDGRALDVLIEATLDAQTYPVTAKRLYKRASALPDANTLTITDLPEHGTARVENGVVRYQPNDNFNGQDTFWYQVEGADDNSSAKTQVSVTVNPINDAPVISPIADYRVTQGQSLSIIAAATDQENDALSWQWQQTAGEAVSFSTTNNQLLIDTAGVSPGELLVFTVTASDGKDSSSPVTVNIEVKDNQGGGAFALWLWLMLLGVMGARHCEAYK